MYKIELSKKAEKFMRKHKSDGISERIFLCFQELAKNPHENNLDLKQIINSKDELYRLRVGKYRIIYQILDEELLVFCVDIGSRGEIYK